MRGADARAPRRRARQHDRRRAVGERAAHQPGEDAGHLGRREDLLDGHACAGTGPAGCARVVERLDGRGRDLARASCRVVLHELHGPRVVEAHEDAARPGCRRRRRLVQVGAVLGGEPVLDARPSSPDRSPVHIFSTPRARTGRSWTAAAMVARWSAELPPAHELSTLIMATSLSPALRSQVWPRHAALVEQPSPHGVAAQHEAEVARGHAGVGQRFVGYLIGHGLGLEVAAGHVGHPGARGWRRRDRHAGTSASWRYR